MATGSTVSSVSESRSSSVAVPSTGDVNRSVTALPGRSVSCSGSMDALESKMTSSASVSSARAGKHGVSIASISSRQSIFRMMIPPIVIGWYRKIIGRFCCA